MKFLKKILLIMLLVLPTFGFAAVKANTNTKTSDNSSSDCIQLNTDIPGVGKCIDPKKADSAFGSLMGSMMKLLINMTVAVAFIALIASGVMMTVSGASQSTAGKGKELLKKVVLGIVLLGLSGLILHTINPNFFKLVEPVISLISNV